MRLLFHGFLFCLALLPLLAFAVTEDFGITGSWQEQGRDNFWEVTPERLRLIAPGDSVRREYTVTCAEPLPTDEWTLDYATVQNSDMMLTAITLRIGEPEDYVDVIVDPDNNRATVKIELKRGKQFNSLAYDYLDGCGGNIHQVKLLYSARQHRLAMTVNGKAVRILKLPNDLPTGPVSFHVNPAIGTGKDFCLDIDDYRVQPQAVFPEPSLLCTGPAWTGWSRITKPATADVPAQFEERMAALSQQLALSDSGRANVLAAVAMYERAQYGRVGAGAWNRIGNFCAHVSAQQDNYHRDYGLGMLYPLAVASADADQRTQAQGWMTGYFNMLTTTSYNIPEKTLNMRRTALLDPQRTVTAAIAQHPDVMLYTALLHDLPATPDAQKISLFTGIISEDTSPFNAYAWLLPDIAQSSQHLAMCIKSMFIELAAHRDTLFHQDMDIPFAYAAYRIAPTDLPLALTLTGAVQEAGTRADLYQAIQQLPIGQQIPDLPARIEKALRGYIAQWRRSRTEASPVARYLRLANWYLLQQRTPEATALVKTAIPLIATDDERCRYRDLRLIAAYFKAVKAPEAAEWETKMTEAATLADTGLEDRRDGWVISAATRSAVQTLVQDGKIDDALALIEKLDAESMPENVANCYAAVIYRLMKTNMPRALDVLKKVPHVRQRDTIIAGIAPYLTIDQARALLQEAADGPQKTTLLGAVVPSIARVNLNEALALLQTMAPADRRTALISISAITPLHTTPALLSLTSECVTAYLAQTRRYSRESRESFFNGLAEQPPATLLALEPAFAEDYAFYTRALLFSMAKACGLKDDPLWLRFANAEWEYCTMPIPWGCMVFSETVRQYNEAQQQLH